MPRTVYALELIKPNDTREMKELAISNTAVGFSPSAFDSTTTIIHWSIEGADVRVRFDGTDPDEDTGHFMENLSVGAWSIAMMNAAKFIRTGSEDAKMFASQMLGGT